MNSSIINVSEILNKANKLTSAGFSDGYSFDSEKAALHFEELVVGASSPMPVFSGILILEENDGQTTIIDGLQRLTTVSLLLCALCENYKGTSTANEDARNKILNRFLINRDLNEPKLKISGNDYEIYKKIIFSEDIAETEKNNNLYAAYKTFLKKVREHKISGNGLFKIISKIQFMVIYTDKAEVSARELYQTLNGNKGISQLNLIFDFIKQQDKNSDDAWSKITKSFKSKYTLEEFLKDFLITRSDEKIQNTNALYNNFKNYFYKISKYQSMQTILENVYKYSQYYLKIINADFDNKEVQDQITMLNNSNGKDTYPYLMEVLDDLENSHINESAFINILMMLNLFIKSQQENAFSNISIDFSNLSKELNKMLVLKDYVPETIEEDKLTINVINKLSSFEV